MLEQIGRRLQVQLRNWRKPAVCSPTVPRPAAEIPYPKGKLGELLRLLGCEKGVTIEDLAVSMNWRRPTVRAALSRLRQRGFYIEAMQEKEGTIYRLKKRQVQP